MYFSSLPSSAANHIVCCPNYTPTSSQGLMGEAGGLSDVTHLALPFQHNPATELVPTPPDSCLDHHCKTRTTGISPWLPAPSIWAPLICPPACWPRCLSMHTHRELMLHTQVCRHFLKQGDPFAHVQKGSVGTGLNEMADHSLWSQGPTLRCLYYAEHEVGS